jgi:CBS domain-containing protein
MDPILVRKRRVLDPSAKETIEETVQCPRRSQSVPLSECSKCGHSTGVVVDPRRGLEVVDCDEAPPETTDMIPDWARGAPIEKLRSVQVWQVLTPDVLCVTPDTPLDVVRAALDAHAIGAVPVVDADRRPLGMVSTVDLLRKKLGASKASDVMSRTLISAREDLPVVRMAATMAFEGIHHVPVVGSDGTVVGILSSLDVLRFVGQLGGYLVPPQTQRRRAAENE